MSRHERFERFIPPFRFDIGAYVLDGAGKPRHEPDTLVWGRWYNANRKRRILARTPVKGYWVSTVFLALDHGFGSAKPVLWETMVFEKGMGMGGLDCWRYDNPLDALKGHERLVRRYRGYANQVRR
jgi:hypothetical protein